MPTAASKELVIDASVAHAAGWGDHPDSSGGRDFLRAVLEISHRMVLTPPLIDEWRRHQSKFTREWRKSMHARRKVRILDSQENTGLRDRILGADDDETLRQIRLKDIPLLEAALRTDNIVVSLDERARDAFQFRELNVLLWVNPVSEAHRMQLWLEEGAPPSGRVEAGTSLAAGPLTTNKNGPDLSGPICMNPKLLRALSGRQGLTSFSWRALS